jgi:hypothetical protein
LKLAVCLSLFGACVSTMARAQTTPSSDVAFFWFGEPSPSGVDQSLLALGRRRGAAIARETPGQLHELPQAAVLAKAVAAYGQLRFAETIETLDALEREIVPRGGGGLTRGELVDLHAYRAAARMATGDEAGAWDDLLAAAAIAPGRPLDPARFPPRVVEAARRAEQAAGAPSKLVVSAAPDDAAIVVDGELLGRGRVEIALPVGAHLVRVERSGFRAGGRLVQLGTAGAEARVQLEPAPSPTLEQLAARGRQLAAHRLIAAWAALAQGRVSVELVLLDVRGARAEGRTRLPDDERLTTGELAAAIDGLFAAEGIRDLRGVIAPKPWYKRPLVWGLAAGGAVVAIALGVGLGVGLPSGHGGFTLRVDLGGAR